MPNLTLEERKAEIHKFADELTEDSEFVCCAVRDSEDPKRRPATNLINASLSTIANCFCNVVKRSLVHEKPSGATCLAYAQGLRNAILEACTDAAAELFKALTPEEQKAELKSLLDATCDLINSGEERAEAENGEAND